MRDALTVIGIDIGGTRVKAALVDEAGKVLASGQTATPASVDRVRSELAAMLNDLQKDRPRVMAVGIGCKGIIDAASTEVLTLPGTLHHLEGQRLAELVSGALPPGCPITADNDARVAMAGERVWGAARNCEDALLLTLGTGVGGAVLSGGRILQGAKGIAGHIGHLTVDSDGADCICGNRGCLETVFSARAIESEAYAAVHRGMASKLVGCGATPSCEQVFACARNGDPVARRIVERATKVLGAAIAGLLFVIDPEVVILSGQIVESLDILLDRLRSEVEWRTKPLLRRTVRLVKSELVDPSGVLGAAALAQTLLARQ
jgi:glucokinase